MVIPPRDKPPIELRLDLGDHPGFLILYRMQLNTSSNQSVWHWDSREGKMQGQQSGVEIVGGRRGCLLYLSDNDPHWVLPVENRLEALRDGGRLEIEFSCPSLHGITGGVSEDRRNGRGESSPQHLLLQLAEARTRIADLEASLSWRITRPLRQVWGAIVREG
jgi:hypothetical protein